MKISEISVTSLTQGMRMVLQGLGPTWLLAICLAITTCAALRGDTGQGCQEEATRGEDYLGTMNTTAGNMPCQAWSAMEPHSHGKTDVGEHNYCRNPGAHLL